MGSHVNPLSKIRIVLVEPAGALNVGAVARVMKNLALQQLVLVNPLCDPLGKEARQMAVHAGDILEQAQQIKSLPEALTGCQRAIATTARTRTKFTQLESPRLALPWLLAQGTTSALIFGPEERGLSNAELNYAQRFVSIPTSAEYPSLNLASAVAICAHELNQASQQPATQAQSFPKPNVDAAPIDTLDGYYQHLEAVLLKIGFLYPHTAAARMEKLRRLYNRANLTREEVAMLRGILRQVEWAISEQGKGNDKGTRGEEDKGKK
ncbi:MAG: RNA methyltransferase [Cyanobacteria bacterium SW_8_48_13]|nr:MAG: RNA methyltransferase [Cyanobacteria bacterium QS_9_48_30]PSP21831.1 MAG: RNA methyltransferase [Cyanobacteria bacterium SW_8_48_13]